MKKVSDKTLIAERPLFFCGNGRCLQETVLNKVSTNIRIDMQTKEEATAILENLGFTVSGAVNIFLRQVVLNKGLPFEIALRDTKQEK